MAIGFKDIESWYDYGVKKNWVSKVFCDTHEGPPMSDEEMKEWDEGGDPCSFHIKLSDQSPLQ
jgi:hypothetical protein